MLRCSIRPHDFIQRNLEMSNNQRKRKMNNVVEQIQQATKDQGDAAMASAQTLAASIQTIATAHADYAKRAMQDASEFISKLTSLKEPTRVVELQSEYVKNAYETFVAEAKKISELYTDFFKQTAKPLEAIIAKNKAA
jgi:phasin family protein